MWKNSASKCWWLFGSPSLLFLLITAFDLVAARYIIPSLILVIIEGHCIVSSFFAKLLDVTILWIPNTNRAILFSTMDMFFFSWRGLVGQCCGEVGFLQQQQYVHLYKKHKCGYSSFQNKICMPILRGKLLISIWDFCAPDRGMQMSWYITN